MFHLRNARALACLGAGLGLATLGVTAAGGTAWAGGNGAQAQTFNLHGSQAYDQLVIDFLPIDSPPGIALPAGCWMPDTYALMAVDGNAIVHFIGNKTGGWFTTTFTGDAAVYPIVFASPGVPEVDANGNDVVDTSGTPLATGHLTVWDGSEDNNKNSVDHATLTFSGTDSSGDPVSVKGHFQFATNAAGDPTAMVGSLAC